ncbi:MAG: biopolymer transporter ExbD [Deltaproteobacteria bacterium]|nr:biopolymer transporter ExbD [Deltaproteobacteria bacterium]
MAGGAPSEPDDIITGINVTPLVDIILVLLIIFMLTAKLIAQANIQVDLPEAATGQAALPTMLGVTLMTDNRLFLNGVPTDEAALVAAVDAAVKSDAKAQAIIAADKAVSHGQVVHVIDLVRSRGIYRFALNIDPDPLAAKPR